MSFLNVWGTLKMGDFKNRWYFPKFWLIWYPNKLITLELDMIFMFCKKRSTIDDSAFVFMNLIQKICFQYGIFFKLQIFSEKNSGNFEVLMPVTLIFMSSEKEKHHRQLSFDLHELLLQKNMFLVQWTILNLISQGT